MDEREALRSENDELRREADRLRRQVSAAEDALREAGALFAATIESLPFDFWARDRDGVCFSQNATARANWGDLLHKRPEEMDLPADVIHAWLTNNRRALTGETVRGDIDYQLAGEVRHMHNVLAPIRLDDAIVGTLGVNIDITERKRAEAELARALGELRASDEKLRMAVDESGIGLWSWDVKADVLTWDRRLCAIFGLDFADAPRKHADYLALLAPEDRERATAAIRRNIAAGSWDDERSVVRKNGESRWLLGKGAVLRLAGGDLVVGAILDVTERRRRDEQLRQAQKLEAVGQLTAGIAHNFNNMLMGILPNLAMAIRKAPPEIAPLLETAEDAATRAADLVRQLMTYAGRNRRTERVVVAVGELVDRVVSFCRTTFDRRIAIVETYDLAACAFVNETQIEQALLNVLINARDALSSSRRDAPRIEVAVDVVRAASQMPGATRTGEASVRVRVSDNGTGMSPETATRIYEPFFTTKDVGKGTGLGLATSHAILREHGGAIVCESVLGKGTVFSIYLPLAEGVAPRPPSSAGPRASRGDETVLVVDDEPSIRGVLKLVLEDAGFKVLVASSGEEAVDRLRDPAPASTIALILLDVSMPGMAADTLRRHIRELAPQARVLYLTGYSFEAPDAKDDVVEKPVSPDALLRKMREVLDRE